MVTARVTDLWKLLIIRKPPENPPEALFLKKGCVNGVSMTDGINQDAVKVGY